MKYVVNCPYCDHNYIVDAKEDEANFHCENCGGQNGIEDVVERIEEPVVIEKEIVRTVVVPKEEDEDLKAIKNFDISVYDVDDSELNIGSYPSVKRKLISIALSALVVLFGLASMAVRKAEEEREANEQNEAQSYAQDVIQEKEESVKNSGEARLAKEQIERWMEAMNQQDLAMLLSCYNIPEGSVYSETNLQTEIQTSGLSELWGTDVSINSITFDSYLQESPELFSYFGNAGIINISYEVAFSNGSTKTFVVEKTENEEMKLSTRDLNVVSNVKVQTAINEESASEEANLFMDDFAMDSSYEEIVGEDGMVYGQYTIPLIAKGDHVCKVGTILGELSMQCEVTEENQVLTINHLQVEETEKETLAAVLLKMWEQVQTAALNYAEPEEFREFFDEKITDDEIEELAKQIRMEQDLRGDYENAHLTGMTISDEYFTALDYNTFVVRTIADYESSNEDNTSGVCNGEIAIRATSDGWLIYDLQDARFFTLKTP